MKITVDSPPELLPIPLLPLWKTQMKILSSGLAVGLFIGIIFFTDSTLVVLLSLINIVSCSFISYRYLEELVEITYINISIKEYNQWLEKELDEINRVKVTNSKTEEAGELDKER